MDPPRGSGRSATSCEYNRPIDVDNSLIDSVIDSVSSAKPRGSLPRWSLKDLVSNEPQYRRLSDKDEARLGSSKSNSHCMKDDQQYISRNTN